MKKITTQSFVIMQFIYPRHFTIITGTVIAPVLHFFLCCPDVKVPIKITFLDKCYTIRFEFIVRLIGLCWAVEAWTAYWMFDSHRRGHESLVSVMNIKQKQSLIKFDQNQDVSFVLLILLLVWKHLDLLQKYQFWFILLGICNYFIHNVPSVMFSNT